VPKKHSIAVVAFVSGVALFGVFVSAGALAAAGDTGSDAGSTTTTTMPTEQPRFVTKCTYSHQLADDPIAKPKLPGASHLHDFFGNTSTNAYSTLRTLKVASTTCKNANDLSGYWVPALSVDGVSVPPTFTNVYYQAAGKPFASVKTIPRGLRVIAGDMMATEPQGMRIASWNCGADEDIDASDAAPTCPEPTLTLHINFPDCWNGKNLDSPDHKSHLAYHGKNGVCPAGYPVPIPRVRVNVHYRSTGGPGVALASGGQYSGHADFFNAWVPAELRRLVKTCINAGIACNAKEAAGG
jgi:hypothetical protein